MRDKVLENTAIYYFGVDQREILRGNANYKRTWKDLDLEWEIAKLEEEYLELIEELLRLRRAMEENDSEEIARTKVRIGLEATDLGNVCMMVSDLNGQLGKVRWDNGKKRSE